MEKETDLKELRQEIARTTVDMIRLIGERNRLAKEVGDLKSASSLPIEDDRVEDLLLDDVLRECEKAGVDRNVGLKVLSVLLNESKRVQGFDTKRETESPTAAFARAIQLQREGKRIIRMDLGEPDFKPPRAVLEACSEALFSFKTHYTVTRSIPELIGALQRYLARKYGYEAAQSELIAVPGGRFAVYSALASLVGEGESAIVADPNWPAYRESLQYIGAKAIVIHTSLEDSWELPVEKVKESIKPNTKAIVLSYPNNPTGKIISPDAFRELVGIANDAHLTVISDEIYTEYAYKPCLSILNSGAESFVLTASFSKTWAMTGFRVGYAVSSPDVIAKMLKISALMVTSVPEFIQYGAIKALESDEEVRENSKTMKERIDAVCQELDRVDSLSYFKPEGAMYVFPQAKRKDFVAREFASKLLESGVSVTPGTAFGDYPRNFRIALGQPREALIEGVRAIGRTLG